MHLKKRTKQRIFRKVASYFLTGALLFNSGDIMTGCQKYKEQKAEKTQNQGLERVPIKKSKSALAEVFDFVDDYEKGKSTLNLDGYKLSYVKKDNALYVKMEENQTIKFKIEAVALRLHRIEQGLYVLTDTILPLDIKIINLNKKTQIQYKTFNITAGRNRFFKYKNTIIGVHSKQEGLYLTLLPLERKRKDLRGVQTIIVKEFSEERLFPPNIISASIIKNKLVIITEGMMQDKKEYSVDISRHFGQAISQ